MAKTRQQRARGRTVTGASPQAAAPATRTATTGRRKGNGRVPIELTIDRENRAWDLHREGYSQAEIARILTEETPTVPISQQSVSKALTRVEDRVMLELDEKVERLKVRQLAKLEGIYSLSMAAFRVSKGAPPKAPRRRGRVAPSGATEVAEAASPGDPRFLEKAMEALRDQRKILGIDAPIKFDGSVKTSRPYEDMTDEELAAEHQVIERRIREQLKRPRS